LLDDVEGAVSGTGRGDRFSALVEPTRDGSRLDPPRMRIVWAMRNATRCHPRGCPDVAPILHGKKPPPNSKRRFCSRTLAAVEHELSEGAVVVIEPTRLRIRKLRIGG
jgi:hypothetical protein